MLKRLKRFITSQAERHGYYIGILPPTADSVEHHVNLLCDRLDVNCIIDVGAHYGEYAQRMRNTGYGGRIVSWEPVTESYAKLQEASAADSDWQVYHAALGDIDGELEINVTVGTEGASFLEPSEFGKGMFSGKLDVREREKVPVKTLDGVYDQCVAGIEDPRVYLKIDAQGYDMKVIEGAKDCLPGIVGLQTELPVQKIYNGMPDYRGCLDILEEKGFLISGIFPVRVDNAMRLIEMDCVMVSGARQ